jgi:hypothetical protein
MPDRPKGKLNSIKAAEAVNALLRQLGVRERREGLAGHPLYPAVHVRDQVALLAGLAANTLQGGGLDGDDVRRAWPVVGRALDAMRPGVCGAAHPTHEGLRCTQRMAEHSGWHEAPGATDGTLTSSWVWALDAVRPGQVAAAAGELHARLDEEQP